MLEQTLGDRMKMYESMECGRRFMPKLPILARIDGRAFHVFTQGLDMPYDQRMREAMIETTRLLVIETGARVGYTQSDEITLLWQSSGGKNQIWFDSRIHKMVSQLAACATLFFYNQILQLLPSYARKMPTFDARAWNVPTREEAVANFVWRERDAVKNSITMAASTVYSHHELHNKISSEKQEMLFQKGINWNDYPASFKRGTYVQKRKTMRSFSYEELEKLPPKHEAKQNPSLQFERTDCVVLDMPILDSITNKEAVLFDGAEPCTSA